MYVVCRHMKDMLNVLLNNKVTLSLSRSNHVDNAFRRDVAYLQGNVTL